MAEKRTYGKNTRANDYSPQPIPANEYGKLPPQALELEEDVLGALMLERGALEQVSDFLKPEMFYKTAHQKIYSAICELHRKSNPIDMHTVTEMMRANGTLEEAGGLYGVAQLTSKVSSAAHVVYHSQIIVQKYLAREIIRFSGEFQNKAFDDTKDVDDILSEMEQRFTEIRLDNASKGIKTMSEVANQTLNHLVELRQKNNSGENTFVRTPVKELDAMLKGGFKNKKLIVVGARPGMGKTQFILEACKKTTQQTGCDEALLFELEMDSVELCLRLLVEEEAINDYAVEAGTFSNEELNLIDAKLRDIEQMRLHIVDDEFNLSNIISKCRKLKRERSTLKMICIDYLQLIETGLYFQTRDLEVGYITRKLKQLAKELDVPIILLAQLNRDIQNEPKLENLRESGNIEQDADVVILIDRPVKRGVENDPETNQSWAQAGQFIVAKHRQGETGKVKFSHDKRYKCIFSYTDLNQRTYDDVVNAEKKRAWHNQESRELDTPF